MSNMDQEEPGLPINNSGQRSSADLLPKYFRTAGNRKFLQSTLDQLIQPGSVKKLNGFIGRKNAKAVKADDIFINASDSIRQNYQLEPAAVIQDDFNNVTFFKDYIDYINQIKVLGGEVSNHEKLNRQESYSWNPFIDWDKFVNFQNYYWLPYGPDAIKVSGQKEEIISTYSVLLVDEGDNYAYLFSPDGLVRNPTLRLYRGQTYNFQVNAANNPLSIKTSRIQGSTNRYNNGVTNNATSNGVITFTVPANAPDVLFYVSENDVNAGGVFQILDVEENSFLDLDKDILGKKTYTMTNGIDMSNGMKLKFIGRVTPEIYANGYWYVEGVGTEIKLIPESELEIVSSYSDSKELLFDDIGFDNEPFSSASSFAGKKDYITISRGSADRNAWSRYNRWFHKDIIESAAQAENQIPVFDQSLRANRPIIEFKNNIKLFNFGHKAKATVDLIDNFTKDVFSTIEGSLGYNIDGVDLVNGMRVLFTADPDRLVKDKIFKVNFINVVVPGRQFTFNASTQVDVDNNIISVSSPHNLSSSDQLVYLNNGNDSITGLINRKIYYVYVIDTLRFQLFNDRLLTVPVEIFETGSEIHKFEVYNKLRRQINLVEEPDTDPILNETVLIKSGVTNGGYMYWYNGNDWKYAQQKTNIGQPPLFDLFDENEVSYSDSTVYDSSTFQGNKVFSYKVGTGPVDPNLNFPLTYKNINNVGDIVFEFNLLNDSFNYKVDIQVKSKNTDVAYLRQIENLTTYSYANGWTKTLVTNLQPVVRIFKNSGLINDFPIDVYDDTNNLNDLEVRVYIDGIRLSKDKFSIQSNVVRKFVRLVNDVTTSNVVTLKCFSSQKKNEKGHYDVPLNLQNNPLNDNVNEFTLGEVIDHVGSIVENLNQFSGEYPGESNLRDLGNISGYGTRFLQHSGPLNLALYHLGQKNFNIFKALEKARDDYGKFKRSFLVAASNTGIETEARLHVDYVLEKMSKDQASNKPYYLSDMFAYTVANRLEYIIEDPRLKIYPMSNIFNLTSLSNKAVYLYINGEQLVYGRDYEFGDDVFITIIRDLYENDVLEIIEYESTDGSFCPATPTKLGLYPKFEPKKFIDDSYLEPKEVIQGHDGSITLAYGDYRDDMLLELEKRIFNNIKSSYDTDIFNIYEFIPGHSRNTIYSKEEFDVVLSRFFYQWTLLINEDYTQQTYWDRLNPFTFNYRGNFTPDGRDIPAFWRGVYNWLLDTDRPHTHPWECLGFSVEPAWWTEIYGPAPYTSDNRVLWDDIKQGIIREPGKPIRINELFVKSALQYGTPVDDQGNLLDPVNANFAQGPLNPTPEGYYVFGDQGPVEAAWRKSSFYPFSLIQALLLLQPNKVLASCYDVSRTKRNFNNQLIYSETGLRIRLKDLVLPSTIAQNNRIYAAGLVNYIVDYISSDLLSLIDEYKNDLQRLTNKIGSKLGSFTSKTKLKLLLDSKSPTSTGGVFIPEENYNIFLNTSSPIKKVVYSGVIITKYPDGYEIRGYDLDNPFFTYYPYRKTGSTIKVGGISESFADWTANKTYVAGKIVLYNGVYYRVKTTHETSDTFDSQLYTKLPRLPEIGGVEILLRDLWDYSSPITLAYGTKLQTIQDVADFIQGYGEYLEQLGFVFEEFNNILQTITNWKTSLQEFAFWTTQNWKEGSVLALSPCAQTLTFKSNLEVVNDIKDPFYGYKIYRVDGKLLDSSNLQVYRNKNEFYLDVKNTSQGIYGAVLYTIQKEHALIIDNSTLFNDVIYDLAPGYRQERIKVLGYVASEWSGGFDIPGFIYDEAKINDWQIWTDYKLGDIVKFKEFYYSAKKFILGSEQFNFEDWHRLDEKPESQLLSNWDYKADQFRDFYDLDTDNFDAEQQRLAQHLIGYQNRQYLENIIKDDVSQYKFYQGMIVEKGSLNVLNKLFDTLSADDQESLEFNEEWALRVGEFGASNAFEEVEFKLDENLFRLSPQPFELTNDINPSVVDYVIRQKSTDVYIKPVGYNNNPWPLSNVRQFLRSAGFVRYNDVKVAIDTLDEILQQDISNFIEGDYIWCAFDTVKNNYWNVYRLTNANINVESVKFGEADFTVICERIPDIQVGQYIGIDQNEKINGFYKVKSIQGRSLTVDKDLTGIDLKTEDSSVPVIYKFTTSKIEDINFANDSLPPIIKSGELIWANNIGQGLRGVYENNKVYNRISFETPDPKLNLKFGLKVSSTKDGSLCAVTTANNQVIIFSKAVSDAKWTQTFVIDPIKYIFPDDIDGGEAFRAAQGFGYETAFTPDGEWLAIAAPLASRVRSGWQGDFVEGQSYDFGDAVRVRSTHWYAKRNILGDSAVNFKDDTPGPNFGSRNYDEFRFRQDWTPAYLINTDATKSPSALTEQGYVALYKKVGQGEFTLVHSFVSPEPTNNERFGSKLSFAKQGNDYVLAVSSPGYRGRGRVYMYRYGETETDSTVSFWKMDYNRFYAGAFSSFNQYYPGDIVLNPANYQLYRCLAFQDPTPIETNPSAWQIITSATSILGFFPQIVNDDIEIDNNVTFDSSYRLPPPLRNDAVEIVFPGDEFGYDVRLSAEGGDTLVISAPASDDFNYGNFKGKFKKTIIYSKGDVVYHRGGFWRYAVDSDTDPNEDEFVESEWEILNVTYEDSSYGYQGEFKLDGRYYPGDVVYVKDNITGKATLYQSIGNFIGDGSSGTELDKSHEWRKLFPRTTNTGKVFVYKFDGSAYSLSQTLGANQALGINTEERFGESVAVSDDSSVIAVGSVLTDRITADQGKVVIFKQEANVYFKQQDLYSQRGEPREKFGSYVDFMNNGETLAVFSANGDIENVTIFDKSRTTFDNGFLRIVDLQVDTGRIDIYDRYDVNYVYGESLSTPYLDEDLQVNDLSDKYGYSISVSNNNILVSAPLEDGTVTNIGKIYSYIKGTGKLSWTQKYKESKTPDANKIKKSYLYNRKTNTLVSYLDVVDSIRGKIPGPADQEIKYKTYYDPAIYSVASENLNVNEGSKWDEKYVGMLWWDLTRAKFVENSVGDVTYRSVNWNKLYKTASIDIYEWVSSKYLPSQWDELTGTEEGFAQGISGTTRYGDQSYSVKKRFDTITKTFVSTYYYWVKNPTLIPNVVGRSMSANDVSQMISDPVGYGYPCLALTGTNSFSLSNVKNFLEEDRIVLNVQYWTIDDLTKNSHSQWKIISEKSNTIIPREIESKWLDSLVGKDYQNRILPDRKLPFKLKYGIESRPRQSMFSNRVEALKEFIEKTNSILSQLVIVDIADLTDLLSNDPEPSVISGVYDKIVDVDAELRLIGTSRLKNAVITLEITNGKITGAEIVNPGNGYVNAPYVNIVGKGKDAIVKTVISNGKVVGVKIIDPGYGYNTDTFAVIRPYAVLIRSDSLSLNKWAVVNWNDTKKEWLRVKTQSYDVTNFWEYIDWYDVGYNQYTPIDFVVENTYQLGFLESPIGSIVKVKNIGSGGWVLLEKYDNLVTIDYTKNYKVIARQNGTIKFKSSLYNFTNTTFGYDADLYDSLFYDNVAEKELKIIIDTIKNKIFVEDLRIHYIKLFFTSLRYVFKEQFFVDWAIKTSFVNANHKAGYLQQKVSYNSDSLQDFEEYIKEVKPYRTKIREYVSSYTAIDNSQTSITDFDLLPSIKNNLTVEPVKAKINNNDGSVEYYDPVLETYPWKFWLDNVGFNIQSIEISDPGSGYITRPVVRINGGFGSGAEAKAYINSGKLARIDLISKGSGYLKAPEIIIDGGLAVGGTAAKAVAIIENSVVRSNKLSIKFDRITRNYYVTEIEVTETFVGNNSRKQWPLKYSPNLTYNKTSVKINNADVLKFDYTLTSKKSTARGYTSYSGLITFETAPQANAEIVVTYEKDFNHLSAADRINFYYNPQTGQLGKDLAQLMQGIDFGGVNITGLGFNINGGWDSLPWYSDGWDGFDAEFDDRIISVGDSTYSFQIGYVPEVGQEINIYLNGKRLDDPYFDLYDGITVQANGRKVAPVGTVMQTWVGNGIDDTILLPDSAGLDIKAGDKIIFRKNTSDGSYPGDLNELDTQLSGGNLAYTTATGFAPDDILLDGEGFVTPAQSHAPEEIVPGHISDAVAIKMFRLPKSGSSTISFNNYVADGVTNTYSYGQIANSPSAIIVKYNNLVLKQSVGYTVNYNDRTISLIDSFGNSLIPVQGALVSVASFGFGSNSILDIGTTVSDGSTLEILTNAPWPRLQNDVLDTDALNRLGSVVIVDGIYVNYELFETDETYESPHRVGIRLADAPIAGIDIHYILTGDSNYSLSTVYSYQIPIDGFAQNYTLPNNTVGINKPYENNVIVIKNGQVLTAGINTNYVMQDNQLVYTIPAYRSEAYSINPTQFFIYINGIELANGVDYVFSSGTSTLTISKEKYIEGATLTLLDYTASDYFFIDTEITFLDPLYVTDDVRVISFYNHDIEKIIRSYERFDISSSLVPGTSSYFEYTKLRGGSIRLFRTTRKDDYIWVIKNKRLLSHSIDFYLDDDLRTIKLADELLETDKIEIILFNDNNVQLGYGYMQFKDMLNRVHYKRIRKSKSTRLTVNLLQKDLTIQVKDGSVLSKPNASKNLPGIIEINGERIEYFELNGNTLSQLRRGTLGTGTPEVHLADSYIIDIGPSETIPYNDQHIVETFIGDGSSQEFILNYNPTVSTTDWYRDTIPLDFGRSDELDVFVGGYRLKKVPYQLYQDSNNYPYSPEGDTQFEADFSVNGTNKLRLTNSATENSKVVVVKKVGRVWEDAEDPTEIFRNVRPSIGDASFDVIKVNSNYSVKLRDPGTVYNKGDVIYLSGAYVGGSSPENDITITITDTFIDRGRNTARSVKIYPGGPLFGATFIVPGETYIIEFVGTTDFTLIGAPSNEVGVEFTATGAGIGTGTAFIVLPIAEPNEVIFTLATGVANILWVDKYFIGNGGSGYIRSIDNTGVTGSFTVELDNPLANKKSILAKEWAIYPYKDPRKSIVQFTYTGIGLENGFVCKSLSESNNPIADFLKNTETVFPTYISLPEIPLEANFDNPLFTMDSPGNTFDED